MGSAAAIVVAAAAVAALLRPSAPTSARPMPIRFSVPAPEGAVFTGSGVASIGSDVERTYLALSPDGTQLAFIVEERPGSRRIWLRAFSALEAQPIAGTENASSLFWSPDSQSIAFVAGSRLMRIPSAGGAAVSICDVPEGIGLYGTWGSAGDIVYASVEGDVIFSVPVSGGTPAAVVTVDQARANPA